MILKFINVAQCQRLSMVPFSPQIGRYFNTDGAKQCLEQVTSISQLVDKISHELQMQHYSLIAGSTMRSLLKHFGAKEEDLKLMESGAVHQQLPQDQQSVMSHRQIAFHRMLLDTKAQEVSSANTHAYTQIYKEEIASDIQEGVKLFYKRDGTRCHSMAPDVYAKGSLPRAMARLNSLLLPEVHQPQGNLDVTKSVTIDDQTLIRISKTDEMDDAYSPTPEGIHQDNTEVSSVTLIGMHNVRFAAETRLWSLDTPIGNYDESKYGSMKANLIRSHPLQEPWETVIFSDRKLKHESRALVSNGGKATRDVIVNFIRKPLKDGTDVKLRQEQLVPL